MASVQLIATQPDPASQFAVALIEHFEGFRSQPYQDQNGVWTIGYGTIRINGNKVLAKTPPITLAQAREYLLADAQWAFDAVKALVKVTLDAGETAALVSFVYNEGVGHFTTSTLLKKINAKDPKASDCFLNWDMIGSTQSNGLLARRRLEQAVYCGRLQYNAFVALFPVVA